MFGYLAVIGLLTTIHIIVTVQKAKKPQFVLRWILSHLHFTEGNNMRITTEQKVTVVVLPVTPGNHPAPIDGNVAFSSSDETVAKVESTGQFGAVVTAVGPCVAQITASFDADMTAGTRTITLTGALEVVAAEAVTGVLQFGDPTNQ